MVPNIVVLGRAWAEVDGWRIMPPMDLGTSLGRSSNAALERVSALDWRFLRTFTDRLVPIGFGLMSLAVIWKFVVTPEWIGIDASLYTAASAAWLNGTDPWSVALVGVYYAAPPPTLLAFVPFVWMPPLVVSLVWVIGSFILAVLAIRSLRLPLWWVAFPPIVDGALTGNPDVAVLALLVVAGGRLGVRSRRSSRSTPSCRCWASVGGGRSVSRLRCCSRRPSSCRGPPGSPSCRRSRNT